MPLIVFASPKGGVGKTTLAASMAYAYAAAGRRVVTLDLDPQNALGLHFGADPYERAGFVTGLKDGTDPRAAWQGALKQTASGIGLLPHGHVSFTRSLDLSGEMARRPALLTAPIADILTDPETTVIADTPPGPSAAMTALIGLADVLVIVLLADAASIVQIPKIESHGMYETAEGTTLPAGRIGFVINQIDIRSRLSRAAAEAASRHFGDRLLGSIYRDEHVPEALARQSGIGSYAPSSKAAQDLAGIATRLSAILQPAQA